MRTEFRINEIMEKQNVDRDTAETLFELEICDKYKTNDVDVAKCMFDTDSDTQMRF